jgi:hypothetical protein
LQVSRPLRIFLVIGDKFFGFFKQQLSIGQAALLKGDIPKDDVKLGIVLGL